MVKVLELSSLVSTHAAVGRMFDRLEDAVLARVAVWADLPDEATIGAEMCRMWNVDPACLLD